MWEHFLSAHRVGTSKSAASDRPLRSEFHKDYDRIIFSSAFRRLSDKTQVVPFPQSDYTRQRLTHSLEVSCVGRSLATSTYELVRDDVGDLIAQGDFEAIVAAACLAHDIGNPPFGHFGERAIQDWAKARFAAGDLELTEAESADLTRFEGNAQSFRVLTRLQMSNRRGGMRLTAATLGALAKYPCNSVQTGDTYRKHGYLQDDAPLFQEVFEAFPTDARADGSFSRHPLALLCEAADDICYAIIDLEDGCKAGLIPQADALAVLESLREGATGSESMPSSDRLSMGRAMVINELVGQVSHTFQDHLAEILAGKFEGALIDCTPKKDAHKQAKQLALTHVFNSERVLELEAGGYQAIQGLLSYFTTAALAPESDRTHFDRHVCRLANLQLDESMSDYQRLLACTDKVSGMTDRYCVDLFRKLCG